MFHRLEIIYFNLFMNCFLNSSPSTTLLTSMCTQKFDGIMMLTKIKCFTTVLNKCNFTIIELLSAQLKPLNVITLGQIKTDNINIMITLTGYFYTVIYCNRTVALTMITFSVTHFINSRLHYHMFHLLSGLL
jgi:hypothetical protein